MYTFTPPLEDHENIQVSVFFGTWVTNKCDVEGYYYRHGRPCARVRFFDLEPDAGVMEALESLQALRLAWRRTERSNRASEGRTVEDLPF